MKKALVILMLAFSSIAAAKTFTVKASTQAYNRLVFPVPYQKIVIPPSDAALMDKPITLAGNMGLLVRPKAGANPVNVFVQLVDGSGFTVRIMPSSNPDGAVFRYKGATDVNKPPADLSRPEDGWLADAFVSAVQGIKPSAFEDGKKLQTIRAVIAPTNSKRTNWWPHRAASTQKYDTKKLNSILLTPKHNYIGSGYSLRVYRLSAKKLVNVEPRDFYRDGVVAAAIDGDVVGPHHQPLLVVMEKKDDR